MEKEIKQEKKDEFADAIQEILNANKSKFKEAAIDIAQKELVEKIRWQISDPVNACIKEFIENEIRPEIMNSLIKHKPQIIAGLSEIIIGIGESIKEILAKKAAENLAHGWKLDKIIKELFG